MADRVGQILGNYQLLRVLGRGAFAEVYLAEHRYLEVPAAIKILHVHMEPDTHEPFRREARTIAHLQHPYIVRVLDFGIEDQTPYLVMEYTPGGTLRTQHPKGTRLPLEQIIVYVKQIASALDYAHQQRVIHRDIKPENLLLNAKSEIVLSDFGLAVVQQSLDSLSTQNQAGTPVYMAPEQIQRKPCAASDQYAVGVLVYEWLCGEPPFRGSLFEVLSQHLHQAPPSLCARLPSLPSAIEDAVFGALAKEPQARFVSVQDFADVLEGVCDATQPLSVRWPVEGVSREQLFLSDTLPAPILAPSLKEEDRSSSTAQPLALDQQTERTEELVSLEVLSPAAQTHASSHREETPLWRTNRQRFLRKVRAFWIAGVFEHSLHGAALLALGLQEQPDAVANPWQLMLQHPAGVPHPLPADTRITEVYDAAEGELLILGAPGSGKSTLLLELARDLLERAEQDEQHPLPVVFNLSSWAMKQQRLADWLVEELNSTYQVPRTLGQTWVDADQILPLLDGLDEVAPKDRTRCIETINTYREAHGLLPLVVCSRSADYLAQNARIRLGSAVMIQPLTQQQVDDYLAHGGEPLWALRVAFHQDAALRELTETPLMLSILTLTYHDMPVEELLRGGIAPTRQQVFERYVERMLSRRGMAPSYPSQHTRGWVAWLARQMKQRNQIVFYIERLQPDWLSNDGSRRVYDWLAVRFPGILMGICVALTITLLFDFGSLEIQALVEPVLLGGLIGGLLSTGRASQQPTGGSGKAKSLPKQQLLQWFVIGLLISLGTWIINGLDALSYELSFGLSFGLCSILLSALLVRSNITQLPSQRRSPASGTAWQNLISGPGLRNGLLSGLLVGLSYWLSYWLSFGLSDGLKTGLINGLIFVFAGGLLSVLLIERSGAVQPTDKLIWSWTGLGRNLWSSQHARAALQVIALVGLSTGLGYGVGHSYTANLIGELNFGLSGGLSLGLSGGLSYWLLVGLSEGVSSETVEDQHRVVPNEGIRRSARNGLLLGLVSAFVGVLSGVLNFRLSNVLFNGLYGLSYGLKTGLGTGLSYGLSNALNPLSDAPNPLSSVLIIGLSVGLLAGLLNGGLAWLRHSILRFLLWRAGPIPWNYPRFLDYAAEHILLRKVGGGYMFVHRLLLEYFASLDNTPPLDEASAQKQPVLPTS